MAQLHEENGVRQLLDDMQAMLDNADRLAGRTHPHAGLGRSRIGVERRALGSQDSPSPIAPTSGRLAQAELAHQVLCGASADVELGADHAGRDERPAHDIVHESRQARGGTATLELARQLSRCTKS